MQRTAVGLPPGTPGSGLPIDGAMRQVAQRRQNFIIDVGTRFDKDVVVGAPGRGTCDHGGG